jgi:hypothetical protein
VLRVQAGEDSTIFWIGEADHALRRTWSYVRVIQSESARRYDVARATPDNRAVLDAIHGQRSYLIQQVIDYTPSFDTAIEASRFAFAPPVVQAPGDRCLGRDVVASGDAPLIDDVELNSRFLPTVDHRIGHWWVFGDEGCIRIPYGPHPDPPGGDNPSHYAMHVAASECTGFGFGLGFPLNEARGRCAYDASVYDGVYFWGRSGSEAVSARFSVGTRQTQPFDYGGDGSCEAKKLGSCWDQYSVAIQLTSQWRQYAFTWAELGQMGWGTTMPFDLKQITSLSLSAPPTPTTERELWLDQIGFFKGSPPNSPFAEPPSAAH